MHEFGAFEAKNKFGHLLDLVERGEEVTITRHGKEVARLVPARHHVNRDEARAALQRIRARAEQSKLGHFDLARMESLPGRRPSMSLVLDSSATLAWIYSDETTDAIRALFDQVADEGAVVPALWRLEIANSLTVAVRRSRIDVEFRRAALADLAHLDITTDEHTNSHA